MTPVFDRTVAAVQLTDVPAIKWSLFRLYAHVYQARDVAAGAESGLSNPFCGVQVL